MFVPRKIVSGAQTGVDRAALDAALALGLPCGGFVPKGRLAEDGPVPPVYPVEECGSTDYAVRTELNVVRSDATLILSRGRLSGGTKLTLELCRKHGRPAHVADLEKDSLSGAADFLDRQRPDVLNVAGPRESSAPGIQREAFDFLKGLLSPRAE